MGISLIFSAIWKFACSPVGKLLCLALAVVALLVAVYAAGRHSGVLGEQAAEAKRLAAATKVVATRTATAAAITAPIKTALADVQTKTETKIQYLTKEVPTYVTVHADSQCVVPAGFVSLWNNAASSVTAVPGPASGSVDTDSGVSLSAVGSAATYNLGLGNQYRNETLAWRDWYTKQKTAWSK